MVSISTKEHFPLNLPNPFEDNDRIWFLKKIDLIDSFKIYKETSWLREINIDNEYSFKAEIEKLKNFCLTEKLMPGRFEFIIFNFVFFNRNTDLSDILFEKIVMPELEKYPTATINYVSNIASESTKLSVGVANVFCEGLVPKIRAKIALMEVISIFFPEIFLPILFEFHTGYFKEEFVLDFIDKKKITLDFKSLKLFFKKSIGDQRGKNQKIINMDYVIYGKYYFIKNNITKIRNEYKINPKANLDIPLKFRFIPINAHLKNLILNGIRSAGSIAKEILIENGDVKSDDTFDNIIKNVSIVFSSKEAKRLKDILIANDTFAIWSRFEMADKWMGKMYTLDLEELFTFKV